MAKLKTSFMCLMFFMHISEAVAWPSSTSLSYLCVRRCDEFHPQILTCYRDCYHIFRRGEIFPVFPRGGLFFASEEALDSFLVTRNLNEAGISILTAGHPLRALGVINQKGGEAYDERLGKGFIWMADRYSGLDLPYYKIRDSIFKVYARRNSYLRHHYMEDNTAGSFSAQH